MKKSIGLAVLLMFFPALCWGQYYFGQNKVQYTDFDWHILKTDHFNIYFYPEEEEVAQIGAKLAEDSYTYLTEKFNHEIDKKIPLIIYSLPAYFSQTNVIPDLIPENVGGFTEFFKERVVIPFDGSYSDFHHVIRHELVHVFTMEKIMHVQKINRKRNPAMPPLWFTEGLAEYWSQGWDSQADMVLRDMATSNRFITFDRMYSISGTYLMYKIGQSIVKYVSETYGDDRLTMLFDNWWKEPSFEQIFKATYDKSIESIGKEWEYQLKKTYFPMLKEQELPDRYATKLTSKFYNVKPAVFTANTDKGPKEYVAFKTIRLGYSNIAIMPIEGESGGLHRIIKGERSAKFESLHFVDSNIDINKDGLLAFASKSQETDVLYVYDTNKDAIVNSRKFPGITSISSPAWSRDGKRLVFSGSGKNGLADLYICNYDSDSLIKLTNDFYFDQTPTFSPDGQYVVFSSDRDNNKGINLFAITIASGSIQQLTFGDYRNLSPKWANTGDSILFTSDRNGTANIFLMEHPLTANPRLSQITNLVTGAFDPVFAPNDSAIIFCAYQDMNYHIFKMKPDSTTEEVPQQSETKYWTMSQSWQPAKMSGDFAAGKMKYKTKLSFDIAQSAIGYDAIYGSVGGLQGALTDVLGNHQLYFLVYNTADTKENLLHSMNIAVTYLNKKHRLNWGFGGFRFYNEYSDDYYGYVSEETYGALGVTSYPFSRYDRVEASLFLRKYYKETLFSNNNPDAVLVTPMLSYIKDTSIWEQSGPIDGFRMHLAVATSFNLNNARYYNSAFNVDIRKYFRVTESSAYAVRALYLASSGKDPQRYYLGGSWDLRGYQRRSFYDKNIFLLNNELRFPLVDRLLVGFPFGALSFQSIRGAVFVDAGKAWGDYNRRMVGSFGYGVRVALGYVTVLRFDFSRKVDYKTIYGHGFDFDFFFGWNY